GADFGVLVLRSFGLDPRADRPAVAALPALGRLLGGSDRRIERREARWLAERVPRRVQSDETGTAAQPARHGCGNPGRDEGEPLLFAASRPLGRSARFRSDDT